MELASAAAFEPERARLGGALAVLCLAALVDCHSGARYALTEPVHLIGRANPGAHIALGDPFVSRSHARIVRDAASEFWFCDLESANGSFVNARQAVGPIRLTPGDRIAVGTSVFRFETLPLSREVRDV